MEPMYWLTVFTFLITIDILTMGLTIIWFAGRVIAALAANLLGGNVWVQIAVFLVFSLEEEMEPKKKF